MVEEVEVVAVEAEEVEVVLLQEVQEEVLIILISAVLTFFKIRLNLRELCVFLSVCIAYISSFRIE